MPPKVEIIARCCELGSRFPGYGRRVFPGSDSTGLISPDGFKEMCQKAVRGVLSAPFGGKDAGFAIYSGFSRIGLMRVDDPWGSGVMDQLAEEVGRLFPEKDRVVVWVS